MIKELRKSMVNGEKHAMCNQCWDHEALGLPSKRKNMLKVYGSEGWYLSNIDGSIDTKQSPLTYLDIRFGNLCNLACRSCGPTDSSLWVDDYLKLSGQETATMVYYNRKEYQITKVNNKAEIITDPEDFTWYEQDIFWKEIDHHIKYIDRLYFTGGEPSINKTHYKLLEYLIENNHSKHIDLEYNSNMVAIPEKLYGWWDQFASVNIGCSIDGINEYANYIRPPSEWKVLEKNLDRLGYCGSDKIKAGISSTISIYNILHILDIARWLLQKDYKNIVSMISFHMLEGPDYMNVQALPAENKKHILDEYEQFYNEIESNYGRKKSLLFRKTFSGILNHMMSTDLSIKLSQLKFATQNVDELRGQKLADTIPWLAIILENIE
jgi:MoaA/NifB/PqqE/SkfB family radical SAM enzyme